MLCVILINDAPAAPNKVALVTGANKGIGKEIARGLAKQGFTVLLGARKPALGEAAAAELANDGQVHFQQIDITDSKSVSAAAAAVKAKYGHLDVLVRLFSNFLLSTQIAPMYTPLIYAELLACMMST